jgi:hypothetical protein
MLRRRTHRVLALFALALALFAALPCAALASGESCCGAMAKCGDAGESPCAQLAATSCCDATQTPVDASAAAPLPAPPASLGEAFVLSATTLAVLPWHRPAPASLSNHATIRTVVLRL